MYGLEIMPLFSPHPVENSVYIFRHKSGENYKSLAHYADITGLNILKGMISDNHDDYGITKELFEQVEKTYLQPSTIKKVDIGGGLIHGSAEDFTNDKSKHLYLCHMSTELTEEQKKIGTEPAFGKIDVLVE